MDWIAFFTSFFERRKEAISRVLDARGCREGWLQGEIFIYAGELGLSLQTNGKRQRYDLYSTSPPMIAEIKIAGGDYQPKNKFMIRKDVDKLACAPAEFARFMILLIDTQVTGTQLANWLSSDSPFSVESDEFPPVQSQRWRARIWKMRDVRPGMGMPREGER